MKAIVVTTITSTMDLTTFESTHAVDIADEDGLSEVSTEVLGALIIGALGSTDRAIREKFPMAARRAAKMEAEEGK